MKRILALLFLVLMMAGIYSIQALADTPISTISLDIKSDLQIGAECSEQDIEITVKKGTKKGIYKIKVQMTVPGNAAYKEFSTIKTIKINVK